MALKFAEGFEEFGTSGRPTALGFKWTATNALYNEVSTGRFHGQSWRMGSSYSSSYTYDQLLVKKQIMSYNTWYVGFAFRKRSTTGQTSGASGYFFGIKDTGGSQLSLHFSPSAESTIILYRGLSTTSLATYANAITDNQWHYIEFGCKIADSGGWAKVRIDGTEVISYTGDTDALSTGLGKFIEFSAPHNYVTWSCEIDDIYVCDDTGSVNNDFLGDITVETLYPTSDGGETGFTPSTGSDKFAVVDEVPANTTDYLTGTSVGEQVTFGMSNLSYINGSIKGVVVEMNTKNEGVSSDELRGLTRISGTTYEPSGTGPTSATGQSTYDALQQAFDTNPDTTAAWTVSDVNAAEFGIKIQT